MSSLPHVSPARGKYAALVQPQPELLLLLPPVSPQTPVALPARQMSDGLTTAGYAVGNVLSSVAIVLVNKKVFAGGFHFPLTLSFFHFCFTVVFYAFLRGIGSAPPTTHLTPHLPLTYPPPTPPPTPPPQDSSSCRIQTSPRAKSSRSV